MVLYDGLAFLYWPDKYGGFHIHLWPVSQGEVVSRQPSAFTLREINMNETDIQRHESAYNDTLVQI